MDFAEKTITELKGELTFPQYYKDKDCDTHYCFLKVNKYIKAWVYGHIVQMEMVGGPLAFSTFERRKEEMQESTPYEYICVSEMAMDYMKDTLNRIEHKNGDNNGL